MSATPIGGNNPTTQAPDPNSWATIAKSNPSRLTSIRRPAAVQRQGGVPPAHADSGALGHRHGEVHKSPATFRDVHRTSTTLNTVAVDGHPALTDFRRVCRSFLGNHEQPSAVVSWLNLHGKEGVDGSSPAEGFRRKARKSGLSVASEQVVSTPSCPLRLHQVVSRRPDRLVSRHTRNGFELGDHALVVLGQDAD